MNLWQLALLAGAGLVAGCLNVLAGGGSLLTLPAMIFLGLPPSTALRDPGCGGRGVRGREDQ